MAERRDPESTLATVVGPELFLLIGTAAAVGAIVAYWIGGGTQLFGGLVAVALLGTGAGLIWWARRGMPDEIATGDRGTIESPAEDRAEVVAAFLHGQTS
ncbi:MAG TPA: hypothetical protein VE173_13300, partial [Longimicrobiales bacterium]|nr:hypothetical protein [Longimicrobiales bacterium]